jgi:hypothetical protein
MRKTLISLLLFGSIILSANAQYSPGRYAAGPFSNLGDWMGTWHGLTTNAFPSMAAFIAETNRAYSAETNLQNNLNIASNALHIVDTNLQAQITSETNRAYTAETNLQGQVDVLKIATNDIADKAFFKDGSKAATGHFNMDGHMVRSLATPLSDDDATTKRYVDAAIAGMSWQKAVIMITNAPPAVPATNDRYLVGTAPIGEFLTHTNNIATYVTNWSYTIPSNGWAVFVNDTKYGYVYDSSSTSWVPFSGATAYEWGTGLGNTGNYIFVKASDGVFISNDYVRVERDVVDGWYAPLSETNRAYTIETNLQAQITTETNRAYQAETNLQNNINIASNALYSVDTNLQAQIITETNRAYIAETNLQGNIDVASNALHAAITNNEYIQSLTNAYFETAKTNLQAQITTETNRAYVVETNKVSKVGDVMTGALTSLYFVATDGSNGGFIGDGKGLTNISHTNLVGQNSDSNKMHLTSTQFTFATNAFCLAAGSNISFRVVVESCTTYLDLAISSGWTGIITNKSTLSTNLEYIVGGIITGATVNP